MAKIRIYELARDLNMTNKMLLDKIRDLDISVKSHMSSLDDGIVSRIKADLFGKKSETIVETRVKPTVIRRRRKAVRIVPAVEPESPPEIPVEEPAAAEISETALKKQKAQEEKPAETEAIPSEDKQAAVTAGETAASAEVPAEETAGVSETQPAEPPETQKAAKPAPEAEKPKPKKPVKKRKKVEPAAKIIKLPVPPRVEEPVQEPPAKKKTAKRSAKVTPLKKEAVPIEPAPKEVPLKEVKKKKKKSKVAETDRDRKFFKKKISFRRKEVVEGDDLYGRGHRARKGKKGVKAKTAAPAQKTQITTAKAIKRRVKIDDSIVLSDLAKRMGIKAGEMIKTLMGMGVMATVNQTIDFDTAVLVASEFNYDVERATFEEATLLQVEKDEPGKLTERPPVVTIMGHVDHGKTSLLDVIRKTRVTDIEAGGITQHIGAYYVNTDKGRIAFLDTPGHEAFTAMRARGAKVTDIVVLVVAADDGVMPQTTEAINHARAAEVPIIVAVNKIDKQNADPERVYRELSEHGLAPEDWGGENIFVKVSAKQNQGIDELLEMILLQAEVLELKANSEKHAIGHVVESKIDPGRGAVATVLVQEGTLRIGDPVVCGVFHGKVRAMLNDRGVLLESAGPSIPVEVIGLSGVPMAGDELIALEDEKNAKQISEHRIPKSKILISLSRPMCMARSKPSPTH
jgi:translation initiation factor IF-2